MMRGVFVAILFPRPAMSGEKRSSEERSDEWKVVSYVENRYNAFAFDIASLQPMLRLTSLPPLPLLP